MKPNKIGKGTIVFTDKEVLGLKTYKEFLSLLDNKLAQTRTTFIHIWKDAYGA